MPSKRPVSRNKKTVKNGVQKETEKLADADKENYTVLNQWRNDLNETVKEIHEIPGLSNRLTTSNATNPKTDDHSVDSIKKILINEKKVSLVVLSRLKSYFGGILLDEKANDMHVYCKNSLVFLRCIIDMLDEQSNETLHYLMLTYKLASKSVLIAFTKTLDEETSIKLIKILFHIAKYFYKTSQITHLLIVMEDFLSTLNLIRKQDLSLDVDTKKLLFTVHQMCFSLYTKTLPKCVKESTDLTKVFQLRSCSISLLSFGNWEEHKLPTMMLEFTSHWAKIFPHQNCVFELNAILDTCHELICTTSANMNEYFKLQDSESEPSIIKWKLLFLHYLAVLVKDTNPNGTTEYKWSGNVIEDFHKRIFQSIYIMNQLADDGKENDFYHKKSKELYGYLCQENMNHVKLIDVFTMLRIIYKKRNTICVYNVLNAVNMWNIILLNKQLIKEFNTSKKNEQTFNLQNLMIHLYQLFVQVHDMFGSESNEFHCMQRKEITRSSFCKRYEILLDSFSKLIPVLNLKDGDVMKQIGNYLYRIAVLLCHENLCNLAMRSFDLSILISVHINPDLTTDNIKEMCGKYNTLTKGIMNSGHLSSAYDNSRKVILLFGKCREISADHLPTLQSQVQYAVRLKLELLEENPNDDTLLKSCWHEEASVTKADRTFWTLVLTEEFNSYKKSSHKNNGIPDKMLQLLIELRRDIFEEEGDLLNYSLMMVELSLLHGCAQKERYHWCTEAVSVLEEMQKELYGSGELIEQHVKDVLSVAYFQIGVMQYEEKVNQTSMNVGESTSKVAASCVEDYCNGDDSLKDSIDEEFFSQQFLVSLNSSVELWSEIIEEILQSPSEKRNTSMFKDASLTAECLHVVSILYSLMGHTISSIQASYMSGLIYDMLALEKQNNDYTNRRISAWVLTAQQLMVVSHTDQLEILMQKLREMDSDSKLSFYQVEILDATYMLYNGKIQDGFEKLESILKDSQFTKSTKSVLSIKSDIYYLLSCAKLLPSTKSTEMILKDVHYPITSPFPPLADCLKFLRSLYEACIDTSDVNLSTSWTILDRLLHCLVYHGELLKQQGLVLEAKSYFKEALLLAKKFYLPLRVIEIIQKIASIDLLLCNQTSFEENFKTTFTLLKSSVTGCFDHDDIYLPEFVGHDSNCSCAYCVYPKVHEVHICFYLQQIESLKQFSSHSLNHETCMTAIGELVENAEKRFQVVLNNATKFLQSECKTETAPEKRRQGRGKKASRKQLCKQNEGFFSRYNVEAKILHRSSSGNNGAILKTIEDLITKLEKYWSVQESQHEYNRLIAHLYCLRTLVCIGQNIVQKQWKKNAISDGKDRSERKKTNRSQKDDKREDLPKQKMTKQKTKRTKQKTQESEVEDEPLQLSTSANFKLSEFIQDLRKSLSRLNSYTDTLIIKSIYQLVALVTGVSDANLTATAQLLSSARTLHQQVLTSCGKKLQKLKDSAKDSVTCSKILSTCEILQKYSEPEFVFGTDNIQELVDAYVPKGWRICQLSLSGLDGEKALMINRVEPFKEPIVLSIDLHNSSTQSPCSEVCELVLAFEENEDLLDMFYQIVTESRDSMNIKNKTCWWDERLRLNKRMENLLVRMEDRWLRCWKILLLGNLSNSGEVQRNTKICADIMKEIAQSIPYHVDQNLIQVLVEGYHFCSSFQVMEVIKSLSDDDAHSEIILEIISKRMKKSSTSKSKKEKSSSNVQSRAPVILILDRNLQRLPWESIPLLRHQEITRMPSLLLTVTHCMNNKDLLKEGVSTDKIFYIVNPRNDLKRTEEKFVSWFKREGWQGIVGKPPTVDEYTEALTNNDIFIYCGHGSGQEYLGWDAMQRLQCRSVSLLMGCSSGKLQVEGNLEAHGMAQYYLLAGSPAVVANLWDVTDVDIDLFLENLLMLWIKDDEKSNICQCVAKARNICKLEYLIGAAPVVYGLPVRVSDT